MDGWRGEGRRGRAFCVWCSSVSMDPISNFPPSTIETFYCPSSSVTLDKRFDSR